MIRYVAIGAVVGFLLSVLLLSRQESAPVPAAVAPVAPSPNFEAPAGIRQRAEMRIPEAVLRRGPNVLQHVEGADAGP